MSLPLYQLAWKLEGCCGARGFLQSPVWLRGSQGAAQPRGQRRVTERERKTRCTVVTAWRFPHLKLYAASC